MKIKEEIEKSGRFWIPSFREEVTGVLSISNEGGIELEVAKSLINDPASIVSIFNNPNSLFRVIGHIQEYGFVILDGCQISTSGLNFNLGQIQTSQVILANRVFTGFPQPQNEIPLFNTFKFSVEGIDEWVWIHGIDQKIDEEQTITISCKYPENIPFDLNNGMRLEITFDMGNTESLQGPWERGVRQKAFFKLISDDAQELEAFLSIAHKIVDLLCFTINQTVSLDSISATSEGICRNIAEDITEPTKIDIYHPSVFYYSRDESKIDRNQMLFRFSDIQDGAEKMINKWIDSYEQYEHVFNLYFQAQLRPQLSLEVQFLSLAQGLEAYHRESCDDKYMGDNEFRTLRRKALKEFPEKDKDWFAARLRRANELSLRDRIQKMVEVFNNFFGEEEKALFIKLFVDTRNSLTHPSSDLKSRAAKRENLHILCLKTELLFELYFLNIMGFSAEQIQSIADKCPKLQWKRSQSLSEPQ